VLAVDTNVVVRFLTGDDPEQAARATALFRGEEIYLPKTVVLEVEWVLRRLYRFPPARVSEALARLVALPNVRVEDIAAVADAIRWSLDGIDFADALHIASSRNADGFATFDADLTKRARNTVGMRVAPP
jgi:predicted nucleic acid-binding protein